MDGGGDRIRRSDSTAPALGAPGAGATPRQLLVRIGADASLTTARGASALPSPDGNMLAFVAQEAGPSRPYEVVSGLGAGDMGEVYRARHEAQSGRADVGGLLRPRSLSCSSPAPLPIGASMRSILARLSQRLGVELSLDRHSQSFELLNEKVTETPIQASLLMRPAGGSFSPYLLGGPGWYRRAVEVIEGPDPSVSTASSAGTRAAPWRSDWANTSASTATTATPSWTSTATTKTTADSSEDCSQGTRAPCGRWERLSILVLEGA